jgi:putative ABC transport system ATP-binding protein
VAFFGPSGCGKTSMLYSISGIDRFQEGQVLVNGKDISSLSNQELSIFRQTGIGIVFQQFNLVPSLTVLKNVSLPMLFVGVHSKKAEEEAMRLLERLEIAKFANRYPYELSGGQQQRVGIARALANNPPIIIADEPLGNLDSVNAKIVLDFLRELNEKDGRTIIMVTHEAWSLKDSKTIFHMKDGKILNREDIDENNVVDSVINRLHEQMGDMSDDKNQDKPNIIKEKVSIRILANILLKGYSIEEVSRFGEIVNTFFGGQIKVNDLKKLIQKPFKEGGLSLRKKRASYITSYLESLMTMRELVCSTYKNLEKDPKMNIYKRVVDFRYWLIEGYRGKLTEMQMKAIDQVIEDRLRNNIAQEKVAEVLSLNNKKFGVGLSFRASSIIAEKLELLLSTDQNKEDCQD